MQTKIDHTIQELGKIFNDPKGEIFLNKLTKACKKKLNKAIGKGEVDKFKDLVEVFDKSVSPIIPNASISLKGYSQNIHGGNTTFTVYHGYPHKSKSCEVGDIMWLSIIHNYTKKISFTRVNFMQNKNKDSKTANLKDSKTANSFEWNIAQHQLHCLTNPNKMEVKLNKLRHFLSTYDVVIEDTSTNTHEIIFSDYIASYGLFTDTDMITLPAKTVKRLQQNTRIKEHDIQNFYNTISWCCTNNRNIPPFYKNSINGCTYSKHFHNNTPRISNHFHFLDYAPNIEEFVSMFMYFSVGELFYKEWASDTPPELSEDEPPEGGYAVVVSKIEIGKDKSVAYKNTNI